MNEKKSRSVANPPLLSKTRAKASPAFGGRRTKG